MLNAEATRTGASPSAGPVTGKSTKSSAGLATVCGASVPSGRRTTYTSGDFSSPCFGHPMSAPRRQVPKRGCSGSAMIRCVALVQDASPAAAMAAGPGCESARASYRAFSMIQRIRPIARARSPAGFTATHRLPDPAAKLDDVGSTGETTTYLNASSLRVRASASSRACR